MNNPSKPFRRLLTVWFLLAAGVAFGDPPLLTWLTSDLAPQFILTGPDRGQGSVDGALAYFQARLPGYTHETNVNNVQRTLALLQAGGNYAAIGMVKTPEREKSALFSEPFSLALPAGILVRRASLEALKPYLIDGSLDLEPFLASGILAVGVAAGRSYGPQVDAILARFRERGLVETRFADSGLMAGLVQMLAAGRVGAVFAYR